MEDGVVDDVEEGVEDWDAVEVGLGLGEVDLEVLVVEDIGVVDVLLGVVKLGVVGVVGDVDMREVALRLVDLGVVELVDGILGAEDVEVVGVVDAVDVRLGVVDLGVVGVVEGILGAEDVGVVWVVEVELTVGVDEAGVVGDVGLGEGDVDLGVVDVGVGGVVGEVLTGVVGVVGDVVGTGGPLVVLGLILGVVPSGAGVRCKIHFISRSRSQQAHCQEN